MNREEPHSLPSYSQPWTASVFDRLPFHEIYGKKSMNLTYSVRDILLQLDCSVRDKESNKFWRGIGSPALNSLRLL
jgi:hypothetical protein